MPYEAFSTLQPEKILPFVSKIAAPTRKFEYGACAFFITRVAALSSFFRTAAVSLVFGIPEGYSQQHWHLDRAQL
jgi:hypothetical protein